MSDFIVKCDALADARNVKLLAVEVSVTQARELIDLIDHDDLVSALDEAQGEVFSDDAKEAFVLIRIGR